MPPYLYSNIPNILTLLRLAILPLLVISFYISKFLVVGLFTFASLTDFFDGYLARYLRAQSTFGTFLDPIADKLIVITALIMLVATQKIDKLGLIFTIIIIWREIFISGLREFMSSKNQYIAVSKLGKAKTAFQMLAILILIIAIRNSYWQDIGQLLLGTAAILSIVSGYQYCAKNIKALLK